MRYGAVITLQGDPVAGRPHLEEAAKIAQDLGHPALATDALVELGYCSWYQGDLETARNIWHQCVNSYRAMGDKASAANTEWMLGVLTKELGDYELAEGLFSASLDYFRDSTDKAMVGLLIEELAWLAILARDYPRSRRLAEESLRLREEAQEAYGLGAAQRLRGVLAWHEGDFTTAREALLQALERWERIGIGSAFICLCLTGLAAVDVSEGQVRRGVRLMGAIDADGTRTGRHNKDISLRVYEEALAAARSQLDAAAFEEEWVAGHELGVASAVALARHPTL
jgi:tetratricopeptide (TPR) repeat protein